MFFLEYPSSPGEWMILMVGCTAWENPTSKPVPNETFPWKVSILSKESRKVMGNGAVPRTIVF